MISSNIVKEHGTIKMNMCLVEPVQNMTVGQLASCNFPLTWLHVNYIAVECGCILLVGKL